MECQSSDKFPAKSPLCIILGKISTGNPAFSKISVFHSRFLQSKYPQLAAFCSEVIGLSKLQRRATAKSWTVPAQLNFFNFSDLQNGYFGKGVNWGQTY